MENKDFAVFILTHGRPDNVKTINTLNRCGYTGKVFFIVDNEDKSVDQYIANFGSDKVIVFDKKAIADTIDEGEPDLLVVLQVIRFGTLYTPTVWIRFT